MKIKAIVSLMISVALLLSAAVSLSALGQVVSTNDEYVLESAFTLGWTGFAFTVRADGSFVVPETVGEAGEAVFGVRSHSAAVAYEEEPYPVTTHSYTADGLEYSLEQFVLRDGSCTYVYSRLRVKNTTDVSVAFPAVTVASSLTRVPEEIGPKKSASADYVTLVGRETAEDSFADQASFPKDLDKAKKQMKDYWDGILEDALSLSGLASRHSGATVGYKRAVIEKDMGVAESSVAAVLTSPEDAEAVLSEGRELYACALALLKTKNTDSAASVLPQLRKAAGEVPRTVTGTLEDALCAHLDLQGYAYILNILAAEDDSLSSEAEAAKASAEALAGDIARAISDLDSRYTVDWETLTVTYGGLSVTGEGYVSATALCEWYIKSSSFVGGTSPELISLAKDALSYYDAYATPEAAILSLVTERSDGTVIIGNGAPLSLLRNKKTVKLEGLTLSSGASVGLAVKVTDKDIDISLSGAVNAPVMIEFPSFISNMEYASVGFDNDSGIVTAPVATSSVNVRLVDTPASLEAERAASAALESSIADALAKSVEAPTSVSREEFESALSAAEKSRTATAEKKENAAEELRAATKRLSPMVAGYVHTIPSDGAPVGSLTKSDIYQKFSLPADGSVRSLFVKGTYSEGISAAVYTLRGDNFTTDELRSETYGKAAEGGIVFELDFDAVKDTTYVLCIFSEEGDVTLSLESSSEGTAHTFERGEPTVYTGASLGLEFTVVQGDRSSLDSFYSACMDADLSDYTKESQKKLKSCLKDAKEILCSPSVTREDCKKAYEKLKEAYNDLDTYASEDKIEDTPIVGLVLIGIVAVLLVGTLASAMVARKKMDPNQ